MARVQPLVAVILLATALLVTGNVLHSLRFVSTAARDLTSGGYPFRSDVIMSFALLASAGVGLRHAGAGGVLLIGAGVACVVVPLAHYALVVWLGRAGARPRG